MTDCPCRCHATSSSLATCDVDGGHGVGCGPHITTEDNRAAQLNAAKRDHRRALDGLTRPSRVRLAEDDSPWIETRDRCTRVRTLQRVTLPSLLDQLIAAVQAGAGGKARSVQESKPPLDAGALSLLLDIAAHVADGCRARSIKRTFDTAADLVALVDAVNGDGDLERIEAATRLLRSWCAQIRATISNDQDRTWRMHGAACTVCSSTTVPVFDVDGTETRQPAMIVHSDGGTIERVTCDYCGTTLSGVDLVALVRETRRFGASAMETA